MALVLVLDSIIFLPLDQQRVEDLDAIGNVGSESGKNYVASLLLELFMRDARVSGFRAQM